MKACRDTNRVPLTAPIRRKAEKACDCDGKCKCLQLDARGRRCNNPLARAHPTPRAHLSGFSVSDSPSIRHIPGSEKLGKIRAIRRTS